MANDDPVRLFFVAFLSEMVDLYPDGSEWPITFEDFSVPSIANPCMARDTDSAFPAVRLRIVPIVQPENQIDGC